MQSHSGSQQPIRTCVGCRGLVPRQNLVRLVLAPGTSQVVVDERKAMPGRGAWIHSGACLQLAVRRKTLPRALRVDGPVVWAAAEAWFESDRIDKGLKADGHPMNALR